MLYMIVETFRNGNGEQVYRRFREKGRLAPDGLEYISSWVTDDFTRCFQVMECDDPALLHQWIAQWQDLVDFKIIPVVSSKTAADTLAPTIAPLVDTGSAPGQHP